MQVACTTAILACTSSMTIRDVPAETFDILAGRAARAGQSLEEYVRGQLIALAERPEPTELWDRVRNRVRATGTRLPADVILEARDAGRR
jgi:plasmid stability protein